MKFFLFYYLLLLVPLVGSGQKEGKYTIQGILPDDSLNGNYAKLIRESLFGEEGNFVLDSVKVDHNKFTFRGKLKEEPFGAYISIANKMMGRLVIESGKIKFQLDSYKCQGALSGTTLNNDYYQEVVEPGNRIRLADSLSNKRMKALRIGEWTDVDEIHYRRVFPVDLVKESQDKDIRFIENHINYPAVILSNVAYYYKLYVGYKKRDINLFKYTEQIENVLSQLPSEYTDRIYKAQETFDKMQEEYLKNNSLIAFDYKEVIPEEVKVGKKFVDFKGKMLDGEQVALSEIVKNNKLVLLDFWASWCGPCMQEMPNIVQLYSEYKDKGLEILGVSSDENPERWKQTLEKNKMTWLQIQSGEQDDIGTIYGVKFIPYTVLINQQGKIVARKLKGEELRKKIEELLISK